MDTSSYHHAKAGLHSRAAFLPLFLEFRPVPERFLRAHLCGGKGRVEARPTKRFLLRMTLSQKHGKAANESIARPGRIHGRDRDRKSTRLNSSHTVNSYAVFWLKK